MRLIVRTTGGEEVAALRDDDGIVTLERATPRLEPELKTWLAHGLVELVETHTKFGKRPRRTMPGDATFVGRVAACLARHGFEPSFESPERGDRAGARVDAQCKGQR